MEATIANGTQAATTTTSGAPACLAGKQETSLKQLSEAERMLAELAGRKKRLDRELATIETNIWNYEGSYLEDTQSYGNIVKGYDGYLAGSRAEKRKHKVNDSDRIFSNSSSTLMKSLEATGVPHTTHMRKRAEVEKEDTSDDDFSRGSSRSRAFRDGMRSVKGSNGASSGGGGNGGNGGDRGQWGSRLGQQDRGKWSNNDMGSATDNGYQNMSSSEYDTDFKHDPHPGTAPGDAPQPTIMLMNEPFWKRWRNWWIRTLWTVIMVAGFVCILMAGHVWVVLMVVVIQTLVYKEVISIAHVPSKQKKMPWFRTLNWYFLLSTNYFLYGQTIIQYFKESVYVDALGNYLATKHQFISLILYIIGFVAFVMNLQKGHYRFQFTQFAWTHMTLLLVVVQSQFFVKNIFEGLIWFILPTSLVICNDIFAYIAGFFFGRTPLIRLSPKKTWEGFIGGGIATVIFSFFLAGFLSQYDYLTCPVRNMKTTSFSGITCNKNPVFVPFETPLHPALGSLIWHTTRMNLSHVQMTPFQLHAVALSLFASVIAPFGGFFASGAKRAFKIKDFGDSIPGHGGITDRMDCQFLMSFFSYMYFQNFIGKNDVTVGHILQMAAVGLSPKDQLALFHDLRDLLIHNTTQKQL
ncbi:hypothetical protein HK101_012080 [Irineochytrium annulatum]|nr:hypothetical protein HK101_012080 [Irineochytrium annulatum]